MKRGDMGTYDVPHKRCMTSLGPGTIIHFEVPYQYGNRNFYRIGVMMDNPPYFYNPMYFHEEEIREAQDETADSNSMPGHKEQ